MFPLDCLVSLQGYRPVLDQCRALLVHDVFELYINLFMNSVSRQLEEELDKDPTVRFISNVSTERQVFATTTPMDHAFAHDLRSRSRVKMDIRLQACKSSDRCQPTALWFSLWSNNVSLCRFLD